MTIRTIKRHSIPTLAAALPVQIPRHCPSAELSSVARTAPSAPLPTKAVAYDPNPTRLTEKVSIASVAVFTLVSFLFQHDVTASPMRLELVQWDTSGISVFFFPRGSIPADITAEAPQPSTWGLAMARWPAINCDPFKFFYDHVAIFDTTLWYVPFLVDGGEQHLISFVSTVAIGLPACGHHRGYPAKNRAALLELVMPHVRTLFATTEVLSKKLVSLTSTLVTSVLG